VGTNDQRPAPEGAAGRVPARHGIRLTLKVAGLLTLALTGVLLTFAYLNFRRERALFEEMKELHGRIVGQAIAENLSARWNDHDVQAGGLLHEDLEQPGEHLTVDWFPVRPGSPRAQDATLTVEQRESLERGEIISVMRREAGQELMHTYVPVPPPGDGVVVVEQGFTDRDFYVQAGLFRFFVLLALIVVVNAVLALVIGSWLVGRPVQRLMAKASRVASGDFESPTGVTAGDELGALALALDDMSGNLLEAKTRLQLEEAARREAEAQLRHAERLATIGKLAAGVAHELGTPLNVISGRAKRLARQRERDADIQGTTEIIRGQVDRMTAIIRQLLDFARRRKLTVSDVDLGELIRSTVANLAPTLESTVSIDVKLDSKLDSRVNVDGRQIQQVLNNLIINAAQAMPNGGVVTVCLESRRVRPRVGNAGQPRECLCVVVEDQGVGISRDDLPRVFEPFFTTKDVGRGTGLGLAVSHGIVEQHEGWIDVASELGRGSRFMVFLPRAKTA
jgi:signal transduction histidine kinase